MTTKIEQAQGKTQIALVSIQGRLDASNYQEVINTAKQAIEEGAQNLLIDLSKLEFLSSSGLIALHSIALLMRGDKPSNLENGWEAFHALDRDRSSGIQERVKLFNPQPKVDRSLGMAGMDDFFEIHADIDTAIESFN